MDNNTLVSNKDGLSLEDRVKLLEQSVKDAIDLARATGRQNVDLKEKVNKLEIDIAILRQGGNI